jgi:hypothetical protein
MTQDAMLCRLLELANRAENGLSHEELQDAVELICIVTEQTRKTVDDQEERLDQIKENVDDIILYKNMMSAFIDEQGLSDEFNRFIERGVDESAERALAEVLAEREIN